MADLTGINLGPYRVLEQLGMGGMATVYKAYHAAMDRYVAIKVLPEHLARDPSFRARFEREARTIARLEHRYILPVHDVAEHDGIPYLVMRYTDGGDLADLIATGTLTPARAAQLVAQVAEGLAYAHRQGVIHRDVKPANVLISREGDVLLSDFGIAKIYTETQQLTGEGMLVGTPAYMAPEQLRGQPVDARTDIYSLGIVLFQALTGECPFVAETPIAVAMMHIHNPLRPPRQINPAIPEALERVVLRALAKDPNDRFQTADELAAALRAAVALPTPDQPQPALHATPATHPLAAPPTPPPMVGAPPAVAPAPRRLLPLLAIGGALLALLLVAGFVLLRGRLGGPVAMPDAVRQAIETARRQLEGEDVPAAYATLEQALAAYPGDPSLLAMRALAHANYNAPEQAQADIDQALGAQPNNALALFARGYLTARTMGDDQARADAAIADYTRAIEIEPTFAEAYYWRSRALAYPKNDAAGEQRDLDRAIELRPDYIAARLARADNVLYGDDPDQALPDLNHVLGLLPNHAGALHMRAQVHAQKDRSAEARRDYDAAAEAAPNDTHILRGRAEFLVRQGELEAAHADADKLIELEGANADFHRGHGFILYGLGDYAKALEAFEQAVLITGSEDWGGRYGRGLALLALGRAPDALADLQAAFEHPDDTYYWADLFFKSPAAPALSLAQARQAVGETDAALAALVVAVDERSAGFAGYLARGQLRAELGDAAGARADLQEALRLAVDAGNAEQQAQAEQALRELP